jgi:hypothetical protein
VLAAAGLDTPVLNAADGAADGGSFAVFATDWFNGKFVAGTTLTLTATFTDDAVATASTVIPVVPTVTGVSPTGGQQGRHGAGDGDRHELPERGDAERGGGGDGAIGDPAPGDAHDRDRRGGRATGRDGDESQRERRDAGRGFHGDGAAAAATSAPAGHDGRVEREDPGPGRPDRGARCPTVRWTGR